MPRHLTEGQNLYDQTPFSAAVTFAREIHEEVSVPTARTLIGLVAIETFSLKPYTPEDAARQAEDANQRIAKKAKRQIPRYIQAFDIPEKLTSDHVEVARIISQALIYAPHWCLYVRELVSVQWSMHGWDVSGDFKLNGDPLNTKYRPIHRNGPSSYTAWLSQLENLQYEGLEQILGEVSTGRRSDIYLRIARLRSLGDYAKRREIKRGT